MEINRREHNPELNRFVRIARSNNGFTLVELIIVTAIIGVLAFMSLFSIDEFLARTRTSRAATEIRGLEKDIFSFASESGRFPATDAGGSITDVAPILAELKNLKDPWDNHYVYAAAGSRTGFGGVNLNSDFDLYSKGRDGTTSPLLPPISIVGNDDDIVRANDGSFVGTAKMYGL